MTYDSSVDFESLSGT